MKKTVLFLAIIFVTVLIVGYVRDEMRIETKRKALVVRGDMVIQMIKGMQIGMDESQAMETIKVVGARVVDGGYEVVADRGYSESLLGNGFISKDVYVVHCGFGRVLDITNRKVGIHFDAFEVKGIGYYVRSAFCGNDGGLTE